MSKVTDFAGRPQSGLQPHPVIGIVVDNVDPDGQGRVLVKFPALHQEAESGWIRMVQPMAGKERGFYSLPEKEDEVLVVFLNGSQDKGIILGQFWNGVDLPPTEAKDGLPGPSKTSVQGAQWSSDTFTDGSKNIDANDRRFWRSRSGHLFVFDDTNGAETVQMWDKEHTLSFVFDSTEKRILLANTEGDIHIRTANDLYLEAGNDIKYRAGHDIVSESANDTKHKACMNWKTEAGMESSHKAGTDFKIEAGTNLTCKGQMQTSIEGGVSFNAKGGATAKLEGSAMCEVTGGVVKIN